MSFEVKKLLHAGVDVNHRCHTTALCNASRFGYIQIVKALLETGAEVNKRSSKDFFNPLLEAAYAGHFEIVKILLEAGANVHIRVKNYLNSIEYAELGFSETSDYDKRKQYLEIIDLLENAEAIKYFFD